jgi:CheY-like chemotaxis protein
MTAPELGRSRQQHRVLCVDDSELVLSMVATILRNKGYEVLSCSNSVQAASIAKSEELDLAILDYEMPLMNGAELATFCKAANPDIKVILFSGSLNTSSHEPAFADLFVQKSDGVEALLDAIEALLASEQNRSELGFNS